MPELSSKDYYEMESLWKDRYWSAVELDRAKHTLEHLPTDVASALDVGCGAGIVSKELSRQVPKVVGLDLARNPLRQVQGLGIPSVQGSAVHLPLRDSSFDLVLATEVVEHLPARERRFALSEFVRIARRYVLLTVPYREVLESRYAKCADCGCVFHVNRHTLSFDERVLADLFAGSFVLQKTWHLGPEQKRIPAPLVKLGHVFGGYALVQPGFAMCPQCGNREKFVSRTNLMTHIVLGIPDRVLPLKQLPTFVAALYARR